MTKPEPVQDSASPYLSAVHSKSPSQADAVLTTFLQAVCDATDWEYGEAWTLSPDHDLLEISAAWYTRTDLSSDRRHDWERFHHCSYKFVLHPGEGLPGRVWVTQETEWLVDAAAKSQSYFLRNQIAKAFGAKAGFGLPINTETIQAVLVFFRSEAGKADPQLIELTQTAVANISALLPFYKEQASPLTLS